MKRTMNSAVHNVVPSYRHPNPPITTTSNIQYIHSINQSIIPIHLSCSGGTLYIDDRFAFRFLLKTEREHRIFRPSSSLFQICGALQTTLIPVHTVRHRCLPVIRCLFLVWCWCLGWLMGNRPVSLGCRPLFLEKRFFYFYLSLFFVFIAGSETNKVP